MAGVEETIRKIVLLGKIGSGKSSLANTLFGQRDLFKESRDANSETKLCKSKTRIINGRCIQLIDTPGLFDIDLSSTELSNELLKYIIECAPGPHAFLLVLQVDRYTKHEQEVVKKMLKYFSEKALNYTTVVFTHGDQLYEGQTINEWVKENESLKKLVEKCGDRCCVVDNKYWNNSQDPYRNNQYQIEQLLKTIDQTVIENRGGYYTNEMLQMAQKKRKENEEKWQQSSSNSSEDSCSKKAEKDTSQISPKMIGVAAGVILGTLLGGPVGGALAQLFGASIVIGAGAAGAAGAAAGAAGAAAGGVVAEKWMSERHKSDKEEKSKEVTQPDAALK